MRHIVFRLDKDRYALPLASIREVVTPPASYSRVPRAPVAVRGVINLRGHVVPVVELKVLLDEQTRDEAKSGKSAGVAAEAALGKIVLLDRGRRELGLLVTDVDGIENLDKVSAPAPKAPATVKGLARLGALAITVLEPEGIDAAVARAFNRS